MKNELNVVGRCLYCKEMIAKNEMTKHLSSHFKKIAKEDDDNLSLYLVVSGGDYFLHLLIDAEESLQTLDIFLRKIWLECCGHMSAFRVKGARQEIDEEEEVADVFEEKKKLIYDYDFGTTTTLDIEMKGAYAIPIKGIELISRNEPLPIMCHVCEKEPAAEICSVHMYDHDGAFFCKSCGAKHAKECEDFADYAKMPIVNSPRTGECDYRGGSIDTERDGVFKKSKRGKS